MNRTAYKPALLLTAAPHIEMIPQLTMIRDCHFDGVNLLMSKLDGASNTIYGIFCSKSVHQSGEICVLVSHSKEP